MARGKEQWATRLGVILAVAGSAVGLGNFLRFPGIAAQNGGGGFMIPYFCALIFLGIPICWAEWTMGKYGGQFGFNSAPAIFGLLGRRPVWRYLGVLGLLIPIVIYMYYVLIESWCLGYAMFYFGEFFRLSNGVDLGPDPGQYATRCREFFNNFTGANQDGLMLDGRIHISVVVWAVVFSVNFALIYRGISKGIERFCTFAMPLMALCAVAVLIRVLTLPSFEGRTVTDGLGFMWNPKPVGADGPWWSALAKPQVWMAAAGQIFFSLSVGFGVIVNYASYLRRKDDVVLSGLTASATNEFFEVCMGGLITIPAAFIFLGVVGAQTTGTFDLGFRTLPIVFEFMPAGNLFGGLFFLMLFLAAITSSLSMLQPAVAFFEEALDIGRRASVTLVGMITALGSLFVIYFSNNLAALSTLDEWVGTVVIVVLALVQTILFAWVFGVERGYAVAHEGAELHIPRLFKFVIKYVTPVYLIVAIGWWCYSAGPDQIRILREQQVPFLAICMVIVVTVFLLIMIGIAGRRWRVESKDTGARRTSSSLAGGAA